MQNRVYGSNSNLTLVNTSTAAFQETLAKFDLPRISGFSPPAHWNRTTLSGGGSQLLISTRSTLMELENPGAGIDRRLFVIIKGGDISSLQPLQQFLYSMFFNIISICDFKKIIDVLTNDL